MKTPLRIFLKENLKQNNERLRNVFELFEAQRCALVLVHYAFASLISAVGRDSLGDEILKVAEDK